LLWNPNLPLSHYLFFLWLKIAIGHFSMWRRPNHIRAGKAAIHRRIVSATIPMS